MKRKLYYLFATVFILITTGCLKSTAPSNVSVTIPAGNFIGPFTLIHGNLKTGVLDTSQAIITLAMPAGNTYSVAGDTTKIQAGSNGIFSIDQTTITFYDATVTKLTPPNTPKKHLNGLFLYTYDGKNLHIYGSSDTLNYNYQLVAY